MQALPAPTPLCRRDAIMRHVYLVAAYENFEVLEFLMAMIDDERNDIYLHVDKKAKGFEPSRFNAICRKSNVTIVPRELVYWADYTQVKAALRLMRLALQSGNNFSHIHFLSDSDLPIKSPDQIHDFIADHPENEFVAFNPPPSWVDDWLGYYYPLNRYLRHPSRFVAGAYNRFSHYSRKAQKQAGIRRQRSIEIKYGSDWFSITRSLAEYLVDNEKVIRQNFRHTFLPSEFYVQTLVWNSHFRDKVFDFSNPYRSNLRHIDFSRGTGSSPYTFTISDLAELRTSDRLFARKFSTSVDRDVIEALSSDIRH